MRPSVAKVDTDDAIRKLRADPRHAALIEDSYLGIDHAATAQRFHISAEFEAVLEILGSISGKHVLDIGSGTGIAAYAFAREGAIVCALEPNMSAEFGAGAIRHVTHASPLHVIAGVGETIPLQDSCVDVVYGRQVLHHARSLPHFISECSRVLRSGGIFIATREHVVDDHKQLQRFLAKHAVHQLAGGEHAYSLEMYLSSIERAGLQFTRSIGPWESVINAFPTARTDAELKDLPNTLLKRFLGTSGAAVSNFPGVRAFVWRLLRHPRPGRMYTFVARKP